MSEEKASQDSTGGEMVDVSREEALSLSRVLAQNYRNTVDYLRKELKWAAEQALERADGQREPEEFHLALIADKPPERLDWHDIETLELQREGQGLEAWQKVKAAAREELQTGQTACDVLLECLGTPMERARFLVLRESLAKEWEPRSGIEWTLIEQMAQAHTMYLHWLGISHARAWREYQGLTRMEARYEAPRVSEQESEEFAAAMTDRFHRLFLRTLRALRDMRRYAPVIVQNAGQVNVASQQVNLTAAETIS